MPGFKELEYSVKSGRYYLKIQIWYHLQYIGDFYSNSCIHIQKVGTISNGTVLLASLYNNLVIKCHEAGTFFVFKTVHKLYEASQYIEELGIFKNL